MTETWTRLTFLNDSDPDDTAFLVLRPAGTQTDECGDARRMWEYRAGVAERDVWHIVAQGSDLYSPVEEVVSPLRTAECLAGFVSADADHITYWEGRECPEHGAGCLSRTATPQYREFLEKWGEELGAWSADAEEARLAREGGGK
jgi:hypothetical protein